MNLTRSTSKVLAKFSQMQIPLASTHSFFSRNSLPVEFPLKKKRRCAHRPARPCQAWGGLSTVWVYAGTETLTFHDSSDSSMTLSQWTAAR